MVTTHLYLTNEGLLSANRALRDVFQGNKAQLARAAGVNRTTVVRFFQRKNLELDSFDAICTSLDLRYQDIGENPSLHPNSLSTSFHPHSNGLSPNHNGSAQPNIDDIDALVAEVRGLVRPRIQYDCNTIQILGWAGGVETNEIYINLNLLKPQQPDAMRVADREKLVGEVDEDNFDRFGFNRVANERLPGDVIAERHERLGVYGKPGAGKTTYLQWLAIRCNEGALSPNLVPIFVYFKDYAEAENRPSLQAYIERYLVACHVPNVASTLGLLLQHGRIFLILDGLDEVQDADRSRVRSQAEGIASRFRNCRFVFSCRSPLWYEFSGFTNVIVSEFDRHQVAAFANKWFSKVKGNERSQTFIDRLTRHIEIAELAKTPLLLTLLCIVFNEENTFPRYRSDVYDEGLTILLGKWDEFRGVQRNRVHRVVSTEDRLYRSLSTEEKKALLKKVATKFFLEQQTLFWKRDVEIVIEDYFQDIHGIAPSLVPASEILQAIELQHGLIVRRASNYCSFSHLTFQEYFTASGLVETGQHALIYKHILEPRWRFVIELISEQLHQSVADEFFIGFKRAVDKLVEANDKIQEFLNWVDSIAATMSVTIHTRQAYKQVLLRAWYFVYTFNDVGIVSNIGRVSHNRFVFPDDQFATSAISSQTLDFHSRFYKAFHASKEDYRAFLTAVDDIYARMSASDDILLETRIHAWQDTIQSQQQHHRHVLDWWQAYRPYWQDRVQKFMAWQFNLKCDWNFSAEEETMLTGYYYATKLLSDCMNRSPKISEATYDELTRNLLRPGIVGYPDDLDNGFLDGDYYLR
ncbi:MAG: NACHT C-terminal helical domain 2-containing protein [Elainellaceae cyanobacterium]